MNDFDNDFEEYYKKLEARMWKGIGFFVIVGVTTLLIALICYK